MPGTVSASPLAENTPTSGLPVLLAANTPWCALRRPNRLLYSQTTTNGNGEARDHHGVAAADASPRRRHRDRELAWRSLLWSQLAVRSGPWPPTCRRWSALGIPRHIGAAAPASAVLKPAGAKSACLRRSPWRHPTTAARPTGRAARLPAASAPPPPAAAGATPRRPNGRAATAPPAPADFPRRRLLPSPAAAPPAPAAPPATAAPPAGVAGRRAGRRAAGRTSAGRASAGGDSRCGRRRRRRNLCQSLLSSLAPAPQRRASTPAPRARRPPRRPPTSRRCSPRWVWRTARRWRARGAEMGADAVATSRASRTSSPPRSASSR